MVEKLQQLVEITIYIQQSLRASVCECVLDGKGEREIELVCDVSTNDHARQHKLSALVLLNTTSYPWPSRTSSRSFRVTSGASDVPGEKVTILLGA
eukprot:931785-Pelagomonas_calceolata.AAC.10